MNNIIEHMNNINRKYSIFSIICISIFCYCFLGSFISGNEEHTNFYNNQKYKFLNRKFDEFNINKIRELRILEENSLTLNNSSEYTKNVTKFFNQISNYVYEGEWSSELSIKEFKAKEGILKIHVSATKNRLLDMIEVGTIIKLFEENQIDNWYLLKIYKLFETFISESSGVFDFNNNTIRFNNFETTIIQGALFDRIGSTYQCYSNLFMTWQYKQLNEPETIEKIEGYLVTDDKCDLKLSLNFSLHIEDIYKDNLSYVIYSISVSLLCILQIFSTVLMNQRTNESFTNSNAISLFTVGQNIIWNAYGCLCHFFLAVNSEQYAPHLGIPAFFFFTNFSVFELRLLYNLWKNQNIAELNDLNVVRKKLIKFYITFYIFLFLSLFFVTKFYFEYVYIIIAISVTWIPQIIHNAIYRNFLSIPLVTILLNSINKLFIPLYFRGCPKNIFHVKTDINFVFICLSIMGIQILIMYMQTLFSPRFFVPCKVTSSQEHAYYRNKEELLAMKKEFEFVECAICLYPLFSNESYRKIQEGDNFFEDNSQKNKCFVFLEKVYNVLFDFHEYHFFSKKPFILTPCNHPFHSECLENWLKLKRECPTDRTIIPPIEY